MATEALIFADSLAAGVLQSFWGAFKQLAASWVVHKDCDSHWKTLGIYN